MRINYTTSKRLGYIIFIICSGLFSGAAYAQLQQSSNYQLPESYIGPGGSVNSSSTNYSGEDTIGDIGIGSSASTNYLVQSGLRSSSEPRLAVLINTGSVSLGSLSIAAATTGTATFSVLNYTASGYAVYMIGSTPSNGSHNLTAMNSASSQVGTEQFGINLVANTAPTVLGAAPVQYPSNTFAFGVAATGYNTANTYRYVNGEQIAQSSQSSGQTNYTISYVVNASTTTPAGRYAGSESLVVVGSY